MLTTDQTKNCFILYNRTLYNLSVKIIDFQYKMTKRSQMVLWKIDKNSKEKRAH